MTVAGWAAFDVLTRCSGQLRLTPHGSVLGIDLAAALSLAAALRYDLVAIAELLPAGEGGLVQALNDRLTESSDPWPSAS